MRNTAAGVGAQTRAVQILAHAEEDDSQHGGLHAPSRIRKQTHTYNPIALREERESTHKLRARAHDDGEPKKTYSYKLLGLYTLGHTHTRTCVCGYVYTLAK